MSFFGPRPDSSNGHGAGGREQRRPLERDEAMGVLPNELGVPVAEPSARLVLDHVAIAFDLFVVHRPGFFATMRITARTPMQNPWPSLAHSLFGGVRPDPESDSFRWGLEFSDGRRGVCNVGPPGSEGLVLMQQGGSGSDENVTVRIWVGAIPSAGPMKLYLEWLLAGVEETSLVVPTDAIIQASMLNMTIWPS